MGRKSQLALIEAEKLRIEKIKQLAEQREKNIEKLHIEAKENSLRVAILTDSCQTFENFVKKVQEHKKKIRNDIAWVKFLECENLPNTNVPSQVRDFRHMWLSSLSEFWEQQVNWWLKCDDRSLLTQEDQEDTRRGTIGRQRDPTGKFYDQMLRKMMKVYNSLEDSLRRKKMSTEAFEDLLTLRDDLRVLVFQFLDALTVEVIKHVEREMISVSPITAQFTYKSPDFIKFLWSFKETALPETYHRMKQIKMDPVQLNVIISNVLDLQPLAVRGLWFKHDFFTDYAPTFKAPYDLNFENLEAATSNERDIRKAMTDRRLDEMRKVRQAYEEKMEEIRLEQEKDKTMKTKDKKKDTPSKTRIKEDLEPPVVDETTYVDVEEEYVEFEDAQLKILQKSSLPENLGLKEHELNLREFQIVNGVLKIECLKRPSQTKEVDSKHFMRIDGKGKQLIREDFQQKFEIKMPPETKNTRKSQSPNLLVELREKAFADLIKIELKLNENIFWWSSPVICRWELWEESEEFTQLDPETQTFNVNHEDFMRKEREKLFAVTPPEHYKTMIQVKDFDLSNPLVKPKLGELLKNYIVPMMPEEIAFFDEKMRVYHEKQHQWKEILKLKEDWKGNQSSSANLQEIFEETRMKFDVRNITIEQFNKFYTEKSLKPRSLFSTENQNLIEVLKNLRVTERVSKARDKLRKLQKPSDEDVDIQVEKPLKDEPLALSELLRSVEELNESLLPIFKEVVESIASSKRGSIGSNDEARTSTVASEKEAPRPSTLPLKLKSKSQQLVIPEVIKEVLKEKRKDFSQNPKHVLIPHHKGKWSTKHFYEQTYDAAAKTISFYTGRLGIFALGTKRYCNLPLKGWELYPVIESKTQRYVVMKFTTQNFQIDFKVTGDGYTFEVSSFKGFKLKKIEKPMKIFELKKLLTSINLGLFPEVDAANYIAKNCEKHKALEWHTYKSMGFHCLSHHFKSSAWNAHGHRRVAILESRMTHKNVFKCLMVSPMRAASVNVVEKLTELNEVCGLDYEFNPPEQEFYPDLLNFLNVEVDKKEHRINLNCFTTIWFVQALLMNIQPLSFSQ